MKEKKKSLLEPKVIKFDKNLDKYLELGLFQNKVDKANNMLKNIGLPSAIFK